MQHRRRSTTVLALALGASLVVAACGDDDDAGTATTAAPATTAAGGEPRTTAGGAGGDRGEPVDLKGVCPDTVNIQTDWMPEAEHGFLYQMIGDGYTIDTEQGRRHRPADRPHRPRHGRQVLGPLRRRGAELLAGHPDHVPGRQPAPRLRVHRRGDPVLRQLPDRGGRVGLREEPADDHVGPGHVPRRQGHRRPRQGQGQDPLLRRRRVHGLPDRQRRAEQGPGRRLLHRRPVAVRRRRGQVGPAGLRLGRAVHLRARDRGLDEAGQVPVHQRRRLEELRRVDRHEAREHREVQGLPGGPRADHPAGERRLHQRSGARPTRSSSTPSASSARRSGGPTPRAPPTTPSRRSRRTAWWPTGPTA